jgi:phosphate/sulfate permease
MNPETAVRERHAAGAKAAEAKPCCPVEYLVFHAARTLLRVQKEWCLYAAQANPRVMLNIVLSWIITLPCAALIGGGAYALLRHL